MPSKSLCNNTPQHTQEYVYVSTLAETLVTGYISAHTRIRNTHCNSFCNITPQHTQENVYVSTLAETLVTGYISAHTRIRNTHCNSLCNNKPQHAATLYLCINSSGYPRDRIYLSAHTNTEHAPRFTMQQHTATYLQHHVYLSIQAGMFVTVYI